MHEFEFVRALRAMGVETATAEDFVQHIEELIDRRVATKADLKQAALQHTAEMARLEARVEAKLHKLENKLTMQLVGFFVANIPLAYLIKHYM